MLIHRCGLLALAAAFPVFAAPVPPSKPVPNMPPIKEVTAFKDGHAFVLHEGRVATNGDGTVTIDYVPTPVLGTFWPYSADKEVRLKGVTAGQREIDKQDPALEILDLIQANIGAEVKLTLAPLGTQPPESLTATLLSVPLAEKPTPPTTDSPDSGMVLMPRNVENPTRPRLVIVKTAAGTRAIPPDRIAEITFTSDYKPTLTRKSVRNTLKLQLGWTGQPAKDAAIGMVYVQKGLRWIPNYKIDLDGQGQAAVKLQATLINELADLNDVALNLVVGVPSFACQDMTDPMSLQKLAALVSSHMPGSARTPSAFSNGFMSQVRMSERVDRENEQPAPTDLGPEVGTQKSEDLFVFSLRNISLKKGERMVVPLADYSLTYSDFHRLELAFSPPRDLRGNDNGPRQLEMARLLAAPKVMHHIRLKNSSSLPLTTAPVLVLEKSRVLCQTLMTYTPPGGEGDLELTAAIGVSYVKEERETKRTPNVGQWRRQDYTRIDMTGTLTLTNKTSQTIELEVIRRVLGVTDKADRDAKVEMTNAQEDSEFLARPPDWWSSYNWPGYWFDLNGMGRFSWKMKLAAGAKETVHYDWHYFF